MRQIWQEYEEVVSNFDELQSTIFRIAGAADGGKRKLAWRGQVNSGWGLTSKLYRQFRDSAPHRLTETAYALLEKDILKELRRWGLHAQRVSGRLPVLSQIAMLQHFESPTRFIDISFNALVAAFFAVEDSRDGDGADGRIFAVDITEQVINERKHLRAWEDSLDTPWSESYVRQFHRTAISVDGRYDTIGEDDFLNLWRHEWSSHYYVWKPPALDARIAAQNGGFLFGGLVGPQMAEGFLDPDLPISTSRFQLRHPNSDGTAYLSIADTRELTCVAIRPQSIPKDRVRQNTRNAVYTIRVLSSAKVEIRKRLEEIYGYNHSVIYPDFPGFSKFGAPKYFR